MDPVLICRICFHSNQHQYQLPEALKPKFDVISENVEKLYKLLKEILETDTSDDGGICESCSNELNQVYSFIAKCEKSTKTLTRQKSSKRRLKDRNIVTSYEQNELASTDFLNQAQPVEIKLEEEKFYEPNVSVPALLDVNFSSNNADRRINSTLEAEESESKNVVTYEIADATIKQEPESYFVVEEVMDFSDVDIKAENSKNNMEEDVHFIQDPKLQTNEDTFSCNKCHRKYSLRGSLTRHLRLAHAIDSLTSCSHCSETFNSPHELTNHEKFQHNIQTYDCERCRAKFTKETSLIEHMKTHRTKPPALIACDECDAKFSREDTLRSHKRKHTGETFDCDHCNAKYTDKRSLQIHRRLHTGETPFSCNQCDRSFHRKQLLENHRRAEHEGRRYVCDICGFEYRDPNSLRYHKFRHAAEAPYVCEKCNMKFIRPSRLNSHMKSAHGSANESFNVN